MAAFVEKKTENKKESTFYYAGVEKDAFTQKIDAFFTTQGYTLKEGDKANGTYEKGNRVMRLLLGALYKYFKFRTHIEFNADKQEAKFTLIKATSGFSGGAVGVSQVKKEVKVLEEALTKI